MSRELLSGSALWSELFRRTHVVRAFQGRFVGRKQDYRVRRVIPVVLVLEQGLLRAIVRRGVDNFID